MVEDMILVNKLTIKRTLDSFKKNWVLVFTGLAYTLLNMLLFLVLSYIFQGVLYVMAGFVAAIVGASLISNYLYLLFNIVEYNKITIQDFKDGFKVLIWKVYGVFFIAYMAQFLLSMVIGPIGGSGVDIGSMLSLLVLIALNPLPETIYQKHYSPFESISYAFEFMKDNWINWLLPNILFHFLLYLVTNQLLTNIFATHLNFRLDFSPRGVLLYFAGQLLFSFIMIYRGHLFKILSTSNRRKRIYMNNLYD